MPPTASVDVKACLEQFEGAIDLDWEREKIAAWKRFLDFEPFAGGFRLKQAAPGGAEPGDWPGITTNAAIRDREMMLLGQLARAYEIACRRTREVPNIRCNYGTGIFSSLFGAEVFRMPDELDTLPTTRALEGEDPLGRLLDAGEPELTAGWGRQVFETGEYFKEMLAPYPKLSEAVWIYHPDLQGPVDIAELLLGSHLLLAFYDRPDDVKALMELLTDTYVHFMKRWFELVPPRGDGRYMAHWGRFFKGGVVLRGDSLVNLSPEIYAEFVKPCDERVLAEFGGGVMHFCGRVDHCIDIMTDSEHLTAVNMSQPELNDMERIYRATVGRGKVLDVRSEVTEFLDADFTRGVILH